MTDIDTYDVAAKKLESALLAAFPECKWWVPTSWDMIRWEFADWGDMIKQGRLEVHVKRDGYGARVPCTTAMADDDAMTRQIGHLAMYTMDRARGETLDPSAYGFKTLRDT